MSISLKNYSIIIVRRPGEKDYISSKTLFFKKLKKKKPTVLKKLIIFDILSSIGSLSLGVFLNLKIFD